MRSFPIFAAVSILAAGCAHITMDAPKEPIKLDVTMRLDIYQHIQNDIDSIENMVNGPGPKASAQDRHSLLELLVSKAYADEGLPAGIEEAARRRKERRAQLDALQAGGVLGEGRDGMVVVRKPASAASALAAAENDDRGQIYRALAQKNGSFARDVAMLYAKRLQQDAPAGTPIETDGGWQIK